MIARTRALAATTLAAIVTSACTIEPPGPPTSSTSYKSAFELTETQPVFVRTLEFIATPGATEVGSVEGFLTVTGKGGGGPGGVAHDDVWVSIVNTVTGAASDGPFGNGHASVDGWGHGIRCDGTQATDSQVGSNPSAPCDSRWTVIVRWTDPKPGATVPLELSASMLAHARLPSGTSATLSLDTFSITEQAEPAFVGAPVVASARASGSARITPSSAASTTHLLLRVPAAALTGVTTYPRLGRLFLSTSVTDWSGVPDEARVEVSTGDRSIAPYAGIAGELEWLSLCGLEACEIPLDVTTTYWQSTGSGKTSSPSGFTGLDWHLEVRLEDFGSDAATLPGLELVARP